MTSSDDVIGLIPCAGHANRISPLPCSKEILPVGLQHSTGGSSRPKVVSQYLLEKMRYGGVRKALLILRKGKWDIPQYYGNGESVGMDLGYLMMSRPHGPPYTLDEAFPFVQSSKIALGFPDILFEPHNAFARALTRLRATKADIVLGLYRAHDFRVFDMIAVDRSGRVKDVVIKPEQTRLTTGWIFAVWTSHFTHFMHEYLRAKITQHQSHIGLPGELTVGQVIKAAVFEGLVTQSVTFPGCSYLDIGTPEGLRQVRGGYWRKALR